MQAVLIIFAQTFGFMMILKLLPRPLQQLKFAWRRLAHRRLLCIVLAGVIPVLLHIAFFPPPEPAMHDEFAYLLQADTFAHGRLANPPRPFWKHFEQFHVISQPVFASKYQPLPAALLAAGQVVGSPYYGLLLTAALTFSGAIWMLYGWLPPSYALLGWVIALASWGPTTYWMNSYWGGLVPALGGILIVGAWPRLRRSVMPQGAMLFGLGIVVLAASRPYEGLILSAAACITLLIVARRGWRWMLWAAPVVAIGGAMLLYYDFTVTGSPWNPPYLLHDKQYATIGNFVWDVPKSTPPIYRHAEFQTLFGDWFVQDHGRYNSQRWQTQREKLKSLWSFFCANWALTLALALAPLGWKNRRLRWALLMTVVFLAGLGPLTGLFPHYAAPAAGLLLVLQIGGLHALRYWNPQGRPTGSVIARVAMLAVLAMFILALMKRPETYTTGDASFKAARKSLLTQLDAHQGKHLVLVHYTPEHNPYMDFVVNGAGFEEEHILWARSMGAEADGKLVDHFRDRQIWKLEGDEALPALTCLAHCAGSDHALVSRLPAESSGR